MLAVFLGAGWRAAAATVFQADFESSVVESNTTVGNLNAGTAIGFWTFQTPTNVNLYGNAAVTQKALCPDNTGGVGYALTANFTNSLLLRSNVTITLLVARGRFNSPGTGKGFNLIGYDGLGNPSFDLEVFANQDQPAGTNGALYWNNGVSYTNWFGTNYSVAGDIRLINVSATNYNPSGMSALRIQLSAAGYIVSLDKFNDGTFDWVSSLLPYSGAPTAISQLSITGGASAGDWFDDLTVTGVPGGPRDTVFQADFQASVVQANTAVGNLNAGTPIGSWIYQMATNVNVYGNSGAAQKALCPDSNGSGGYGLTAHFTTSALLKSNVTVTLLLARGRISSSGTGKSFNLIGYDALGNPSFDLQVFANQDQPAGTNGALYWNNGANYTNWFGTNFSVAGDIRNISVSATGYNPASMSALKIQLLTNGYTVALDRLNNGTTNWISSLLPYNGSPKSISRISITGGTGAGDWFDDLIVTGVPGGSGVKLVKGGSVSIQPEDEAQLITDWGFDIKGTSGNNVTPSYAQTLFVTDRMSILRVPIWGTASDPAHPSSGVVLASYYADQLYAMTNARAANSNVIFFASKKLDGQNSFPSWVKDANGVIASQYALLLADYLQFIETNGFTIDVLGIDNERAFNEGDITPGTYNSVVNQLRSLAVSRGFTLPKQFIGPENYNPDPTWLNTLISSGWGTNVDLVGTHYYPGNRVLASLRSLVGDGGTRSDWHSEVHWDGTFGDDIDNAEVALATLFDCTDTGLSAFVWWAYTRAGVKGGIEQAFTASTARTRPVTTTDSDGTAATLGKLIARAYRDGTNLVVWVLNNTTNVYGPCAFGFDRGTLTGPANYRQWDITGSVTDNAALASTTDFNLIVGARTVTLITVGYVAPGPDAYYALEGNALDASGNGNDGTLFNSPTFVPGRIGTQGLQFYGADSYVQIPRAIGGATNFSITFWLKTTSSGGSGTQWHNGAGLVDGEVSGSANDFGVSLLEGKVAFGVGDPDTTLKTSATVSDGQWHHVAVTRNGFDGVLTIYLDGAADTNTFGPTGPLTAPPFLRLGSLQSGAAGKFFNGTLDDVRLYNGLLEPSAITGLAAPPNQPPTLAVLSNRLINPGNTLTLTNTATDPEVPATQALTFSLLTNPTGAVLGATNGILTWRPAVAQANTSNLFRVRVADDGAPSLAATQQFNVFVNPLADPRVLSVSNVASGLRLRIDGDDGPDYTVQATTNMTNWTNLLTTNSPNVPFNWTDTNAGSFLQRFYRVLLGP